MFQVLSKSSLATIFLFSLSLSSAYDLEGKVTRISDGDTFLIYTQAKIPHKIRMLDINAPERATAYYKKSKLMLKSLILNQSVSLKCTKLGSYNRDLCEVYIDKTNINKKMLEIGGAWVFTKYYNVAKDKKQLLKIQQKAKKLKKGLWKLEDYNSKQ